MYLLDTDRKLFDTDEGILVALLDMDATFLDEGILVASGDTEAIDAALFELDLDVEWWLLDACTIEEWLLLFFSEYLLLLIFLQENRTRLPMTIAMCIANG